MNSENRQRERERERERERGAILDYLLVYVIISRSQKAIKNTK